MQARIDRSQSYIKNAVAHIVVVLLEEMSDGEIGEVRVAVDIPVATLAGKTAAQRRDIIRARVLAHLTPPARTPVDDDGSVFTL